jgi:hypothetical protein
MDGGGSNYIEKGLQNGWRKVSIRDNMEEKRKEFFLVFVILRLLKQLLMNSSAPMT